MDLDADRLQLHDTKRDAPGSYLDKDHTVGIAVWWSQRRDIDGDDGDCSVIRFDRVIRNLDTETPLSTHVLVRSFTLLR
jgi:hypothetical protein